MFLDTNRALLFRAGEEVWQQVWAVHKKFNQLDDRSIALFLNLSWESPSGSSAASSSTSQFADKTSSAKISKAKIAPAPAAKKAAKKPSNAFAMLAAADDEEEAEGNDSKEKQVQIEKAAASPQPFRPRGGADRAAAPAGVKPIDEEFGIQHLDLSRLSFISESLICRFAIQS